MMQKKGESIPAAEVIKTIKSGEPVEIINAVIEGPLELNSIIVKGEVTIKQTRIKGPVDWSFAVFKKVINLENSTFEKDILLNGVTFNSEANFGYSKIGGNADFTGALFEQKAIFNNAQIEGDACFDSATFEDEALFRYSKIGGNAEFNGAVFFKHSSFNSSQIEGHAHFKSAIFKKDKAVFRYSKIGGNASFTDAVFETSIRFHGSQVEGHAHFNSAIFEDEANFRYSKIGDNAKFNKALFKQKAVFKRIHVEGDTFFEETLFTNSVDFQNASFRTIFLTKIQCLLSWDDVPGNDNLRLIDFLRKNYDIDWVKTAKTEKINDGKTIKVSTEKNHILLKLNNEETKMNLEIDDGRTDKFIAKREKRKLNIYQETKIDLRGCKYDRIDPTSCWEQLIACLYPFDRQPFTQLEETFRHVGLNEFANKIYYKRKRLESAQKTLRENPISWLMDHCLWLLTGYGVRLHYLIAWILFFLVIGTFIFQFSGAVVPNPNLKSPPKWGSQDTLSTLEAFWVSFRTFLPIEIPSGADWIPSHKMIWLWLLGIKFTTFATILKLAGWILVPIGIAHISGILKR